MPALLFKAVNMLSTQELGKASKLKVYSRFSVIPAICVYMTEKAEKHYLLMARGSSHIRYFKRFAASTSLKVSVVQVNKTFFHPGYFSYWRFTNSLDIDSYLTPHFAKKRKKFPRFCKTVFWGGYEWLMKVYARAEIAKFCGLIEKMEADVVGAWNGQKLPSSSVAFAAKAMDKEVVYFENGLLPHSTTCDVNGVNCLNSLPRDEVFYEQFSGEVTLPQTLQVRERAKAKAEGIAIDALPERYIFVPFQVETDSQVISNSPWIKSMAQLWQHIVNALDMANDPNLTIVIKEHPSDVIRHDKLHNKDPRIIFTNQCSTQELIENAEAVMTINSTVGIESLLLGKKVIVLGEACYDIPSVAYRVRDEESMAWALTHLNECGFDENRQRQFLQCLNDYYVIPQAWAQAKGEHFKALESRLQQTDPFSEKIAKFKEQKRAD